MFDLKGIIEDNMTPNVLILEDDDQLARLYGKVLERSGYTVTVVSTLEEAKIHLYGYHYRVFLCDLVVGKATTLSFLEEHLDWLKALPTRVIAISANDDFRHECADFGLKNFVAKPISNHQLVALIDNQMGFKRATVEIKRLVD
jgi:DNA-binding NtrC family response regulator